jgi:hypothetical protein
MRGLETAQDVGIAREPEGLAARNVTEAYHRRRVLQRVERDMQYWHLQTPHYPSAAIGLQPAPIEAARTVTTKPTRNPSCPT